MVKGQSEYAKIAYGFLLVPNSNFGRGMRCLQDICGFSLESFFGISVLTLMSRDGSKVKVDLGFWVWVH